MTNFSFDDIFRFNSNTLSPFYFITWFLSIFYIISYFRTNSKTKNKLIFFLSIFFIIYNIILISFQVEGLRSPFKYNITFYIGEIILFGYFLTQLFNSNRATFFLLLLLLVLLFHNNIYDFNRIDNISSKSKEIFLLKNETFDDCVIIKYNLANPPLDLYFDRQQNLIFIYSEEKDGLINQFRKILKNRTCYYYFEGYYSEQEYFEGLKHLNFEDVKTIMRESNCTYRIKKYGSTNDKEIKLMRIDC